MGITDVARRAGVSASTVSRALRDAGNVSAATRDRVRRAAAELAYVPSPAASRLASGRTGAVGVVVPFTTRWFFAEVIAGVEGALREDAVDLLLYNLGDRALRGDFFQLLPMRRRVDAVLAIASSLSGVELTRLAAVGVPVVTIGRRYAGLPGVGVDDEAGAATAVRHLLLLGHREVMMISGSPDDPLGRTTTGARTAGFRRALAEAGIECGADRVVAEPWGIEGGSRAAERILSRADLPSAIFAESDEMAFGALCALRRAGLDVPGDVSLVGFDDHEVSGAYDLTTVAQPVRDQGEQGARLLLRLLADRAGADRGADGVPEIVLPTRLVVRGTTGPPRRPGPPGR
ncbi:MAG TPA: LacI family DNA-binding transcriptional regulator [Pseudonocardia sp.]|nr:LacI family DNA-binding transcriptional regulator [Pseudonocardia sp.]